MKVPPGLGSGPANRGNPQPGNGEGEPHIVPQVTQTKAQAMKELRSLTADEQWLASATVALPE